MSVVKVRNYIGNTNAFGRLREKCYFGRSHISNYQPVQKFHLGYSRALTTFPYF